MEQQNDLLATLLALEKDRNIKAIEKKLRDEDYFSNPAMEYYKAHCYYTGFIYEQNIDEAIQHLKASALGNYGSACYMLSNIFEKGEGVAVDLEVADEYLVKASDLGYLPAQNKLGEIYLVGRNTIGKDEVEAYVLFSLCFQHNYTKGTVNYAHCLMYGIGCDANIDRAFNILYKLVKEDNNPDANYELGLAYFNGVKGHRDSIRCTYHLLEATNNGNYKAAKLLGDCYYDGFGVRIDHKIAYKYHKFAADHGDLEALKCVANSLYYGDGVPTNFKEAVNSLVKAAELGDSDAQVTLGNRYYYGDGFRRNYSRAAYWYQNAASSDNPIGLKNYADMLEAGQGVKKDVGKAIELYTKAVILNNYDACVPLADIYNRGRRGFKRDYEKALQYYEIAYKNIDDENAAFEYAELLSAGKGVVVPDYTRAAKAYEYAAEKGHDKAIKICGEYYLKGIGVAKDYEKALRYYLEASKRGDEEAAILVNLIRRSVEFN